jgi:hypothetical protein
MDGRLISGKEPAKTDRWRVRAAFRKRERTHANRDDPTCSRVRGCIAWYGRPGQNESSRTAVVIDRSTYEVPDFRNSLPLVDEYGFVAIE